MSLADPVTPEAVRHGRQRVDLDEEFDSGASSDSGSFQYPGADNPAMPERQRNQVNEPNEGTKAHDATPIVLSQDYNGRRRDRRFPPKHPDRAQDDEINNTVHHPQPMKPPRKRNTMETEEYEGPTRENLIRRLGGDDRSTPTNRTEDRADRLHRLYRRPELVPYYGQQYQTYHTSTQNAHVPYGGFSDSAYPGPYGQYYTPTAPPPQRPDAYYPYERVPADPYLNPDYRSLHHDPRVYPIQQSTPVPEQHQYRRGGLARDRGRDREYRREYERDNVREEIPKVPSPPQEEDNMNFGERDPERNRLQREIATLKMEQDQRKAREKEREDEMAIRKSAEDEFRRRYEAMKKATEEAEKEVARARNEAERTARMRLEEERKAELERQKQHEMELALHEKNMRSKLEAEEAIRQEIRQAEIRREREIMRRARVEIKYEMEVSQRQEKIEEASRLAMRNDIRAELQAELQAELEPMIRGEAQRIAQEMLEQSNGQFRRQKHAENTDGVEEIFTYPTSSRKEKGRHKYHDEISDSARPPSVPSPPGTGEYPDTEDTESVSTSLSSRSSQSATSSSHREYTNRGGRGRTKQTRAFESDFRLFIRLAAEMYDQMFDSDDQPTEEVDSEGSVIKGPKVDKERDLGESHQTEDRRVLGVIEAPPERLRRGHKSWPEGLFLKKEETWHNPAQPTGKETLTQPRSRLGTEGVFAFQQPTEQSSSVVPSAVEGTISVESVPKVSHNSRSSPSTGVQDANSQEGLDLIRVETICTTSPTAPISNADTLLEPVTAIVFPSKDKKTDDDDVITLTTEDDARQNQTQDEEIENRSEPEPPTKEDGTEGNEEEDHVVRVQVLAKSRTLEVWSKTHLRKVIVLYNKFAMSKRI